jgi:hypothetical protein
MSPQPALVMNPETQIAELQSEYDSQKSSGLEDAARLMNATSGLFSSFSDDEKSRQQRREAEQQEWRYQQEDREREDRRADLQQQIAYWKNSALRRTTLEPGASVTGEFHCELPSGEILPTLAVSVAGSPGVRYQLVVVE